MDKISFYLLNVIINSFLTFFTACLLIEALLKICRIRPGRASAYLRMVPFGKILFDLCYYDFTKWAYAKGIDPLTCVEGSRSLNIALGNSLFGSGISLTALHDYTFSLADLLGQSLPAGLLRSFLLIFIAMTGTIFAGRLTRAIKAYRNVQSHLPHIPCTLGYFLPRIVIPEHSFSKGEYRAVYLHEEGHLKHRDNLVRFLLYSTRALFWWIPSKWLQGRIEQDQEVGCDARSVRKGACPVDLLRALGKTAKKRNIDALSCLAGHRSFSKRIEYLFKKKSSQGGLMEVFQTLIASLAALFLILLGRYWIF